MERAEEPKSDYSSDSASVLSLCCSSSSFEGREDSDSDLESGDLDRECAVFKPYLYEPEDSDLPSPTENESSEHQMRTDSATENGKETFCSCYSTDAAMISSDKFPCF